MISLNHGLKLKSSPLLHAYKITADPRQAAQNLAFPAYPTRKFGLNAEHRPGSMLESARRRRHNLCVPFLRGNAFRFPDATFL